MRAHAGAAPPWRRRPVPGAPRQGPEQHHAPRRSRVLQLVLVNVLVLVCITVRRYGPGAQGVGGVLAAGLFATSAHAAANCAHLRAAVATPTFAATAAATAERWPVTHLSASPSPRSLTLGVLAARPVASQPSCRLLAPCKLLALVHPHPRVTRAHARQRCRPFPLTVLCGAHLECGARGRPLVRLHPRVTRTHPRQRVPPFCSNSSAVWRACGLWGARHTVPAC
jgi:hypothetical protein